MAQQQWQQQSQQQSLDHHMNNLMEDKRRKIGEPGINGAQATGLVGEIETVEQQIQAKQTALEKLRQDHLAEAAGPAKDALAAKILLAERKLNELKQSLGDLKGEKGSLEGEITQWLKERADKEEQKAAQDRAKAEKQAEKDEAKAEKQAEKDEAKAEKNADKGTAEAKRDELIAGAQKEEEDADTYKKIALGSTLVCLALIAVCPPVGIIGAMVSFLAGYGQSKVQEQAASKKADFESQAFSKT